MLYTLKTVLKTGKYSDKTIEQIIAEDKKYLFELLKEGNTFDDEVCERAKLKKNVRDVSIKAVVVEHEKDEIMTKKFAVDKANLKVILEEIINGNTGSSKIEDEKEEVSANSI
jgi:hypothetical protein